ncbi:MAG: recombinase family protein [Chloroflexi bacterium]|nr:recombinase family protein [Chloroflexota bacterium]
MIKRAILYARVSTDEQAEKGYSLTTQLAAMREYAKHRHFQVVLELADDCSGSIPIRDRPQGKKIYDYIDRKEADAVLLFTNDRTARDDLVLEYLLFKSFLYDRGVELHYTDTGLDPYTMEGNLVGYLRAHQATAEKNKIRERTCRGRNSKAMEGNVGMTGVVPYGIRKVGAKKDAQWQWDPDTIQVVRWIFEWYHHERLSLGAIGVRLEKRGIKPPMSNRSGKPYWYAQTIRSILQNEVWAGVTYWGKSRVVGHKQVKQPRDQWTAIPVPHLAIVSHEVFNAIQVRLQEGILMSRRRARWDYLLTGFSRCGVCGRAVAGGRSGAISERHPNYWYFYRCTSHTVPERESCPQYNICFSAERTHNVVWHWIEGLVADDAALDVGLEEMAKRRGNETHSLEERQARVISRLAETKKSIDRLTARIAEENDDDVLASFENQLSQIKAQRAGLQQEKEKLEKSINEIDVTPELKDRIRTKAAKIRARLNCPNGKDRRELFRDLRLKLKFYYNKDTGERTVEASCELCPDPEPLSLDADNKQKTSTIVLRSC